MRGPKLRRGVDFQNKNRRKTDGCKIWSAECKLVWHAEG